MILAPKTVRKYEGGKWGYSMNFGECSKQPIIAPQFEVAEKFGANGLAKVSKNGKWGYINLKGIEIIQLDFDEVGDFDSGLVPIRLQNKWGYADAKGDNVIPPFFFDAVSGVWRNELSAVRLEKKWGFISPRANSRGDTVIKPVFDKVTEFQNGLAKVEVKKKWGVIDTAGNFVIEPKFDAIFSTAYPQLLLVVSEQKYGYYYYDSNRGGKEIIPASLVRPVKARYDSGGVQVVLNAEALTSDSNAPATTAKPDVLTSAWYFLDSPNEKLKFDENGKALFWRNGEWFYVNQKGMLIK